MRKLIYFVGVGGVDYVGANRQNDQKQLIVRYKENTENINIPLGTKLTASTDPQKTTYTPTLINKSIPIGTPSVPQLIDLVPVI